MSETPVVEEESLTEEQLREKEIEEYLASKYFPPMYSAEESTLLIYLNHLFHFGGRNYIGKVRKINFLFFVVSQRRLRFLRPLTPA
jgi:hypothetical protein